MEETTMEGVGVPVRVSGAVEPLIAAINSPADKVEALRRVQVFADFPDEQLNWFADNVEERRLSPGDVLFRKGDPAEIMSCLPGRRGPCFSQRSDRWIRVHRTRRRSGNGSQRHAAVLADESLERDRARDHEHARAAVSGADVSGVVSTHAGAGRNVSSVS